MRAIGFKTSLPLTEADSFVEFEKEIPVPTGRQLLVKIKAISVNPVDYKIRQNSLKDQIVDIPKIIGWDAAGIIEAVGEEAGEFPLAIRCIMPETLIRTVVIRNTNWWIKTS
ncbi:MAG: alcohol dehydrogenase catalytic domain-containing protein [Pedobacter sp.]